METTKLKPIQENHVHAAFRLIEDNRTYLVAECDPLPHLGTIEDTLFMIQDAIGRYTRREGLMAGIWHQGQLVGMVGHHNLDRLNRTVQLQVWVSQHQQRRGFGTRAMRAIVKYSFQDMSMNRLEMRFREDNIAAQRLAEKLGFMREGLLRQGLVLDGQPTDAAMYGLLLDDWLGF